MLFQIAKEFRSLPDLGLTAIGVGSKDVDQLLDLVRSIRRRMEGASRIQLNVDVDEATTPLPSVSITGSAGSNTPVTIQGSVTGRLLAAWDRLSEAVIVSLGPRELFLRTGYEEAEIRQATFHLDRTRWPTAGRAVRDGDITAE